LKFRLEIASLTLAMTLQLLAFGIPAGGMGFSQ
jgi:hypothetical protein